MVWKYSTLIHERKAEAHSGGKVCERCVKSVCAPDREVEALRGDSLPQTR